MSVDSASEHIAHLEAEGERIAAKLAAVTRAQRLACTHQRLIEVERFEGHKSLRMCLECRVEELEDCYMPSSHRLSLALSHFLAAASVSARPTKRTGANCFMPVTKASRMSV